MKLMMIFIIFLVSDAAAMFSVPFQVRHEYWWRILPGGGIVIAAEYHFGNKMTVHNAPVTTKKGNNR